jgi:purine nucleosidase
VLDFAEVWFQHAQVMIFHDPLAATTIFDPEICSFARGQIVTDHDLEPGRLKWFPDGNANHEVAETVDVQRFYRHYFGTLGVD